MRHLFVFVLLTVVAAMTACGPIYSTDYDFIAPKSDMSKMCTADCVQSKNMCEQSCRMENQDCRFRAQRDADRDYDRYLHEHRPEGNDKKRSDFDRSYQCNMSCNCEPTYRSCYSACGGTVLEKRTCVAFCDKK